jgi:hypothetical protein
MFIGVAHNLIPPSPLTKCTTCMILGQRSRRTPSSTGSAHYSVSCVSCSVKLAGTPKSGAEAPRDEASIIRGNEQQLLRLYPYLGINTGVPA